VGEGSRELLPGHRLADRYVVEELVARGGMARVYRALDERLDRAVAIKVLAEPFADDPSYVRRFLDEARTAASISHPNLAHVYDSGEEAGAQFIVLELLEGYRSLRDELGERGHLPAERAIEVATAVLAGLAPLHAHGLVHCDVKAGNILMAPGSVKLIDFGIAQPLQQLNDGPTSVGSLHSMSPEQLRGELLTAASDTFAVGVVLYQSLTGRVPFPGETPAAVAAQQAKGLSAGPSDLVADIPPLLDAVVREALEPDPGRRFASAEAMTTALGAAAASLATAVPQVEPDDDTTTFVRVASPASADAAAGRSGESSQARGRTGSRGAVVLALVSLAAAATLMVVLALNGGNGPRQPVDAATETHSHRPSPTQAAGTVKVPNTIGMSEAQAEAAARSAGLTWRLEWQVDPSKPAGVYDQSPRAGTSVEEGARFVMYAYRTR
jgi:serine/threonine-protein kinase